MIYPPRLGRSSLAVRRIGVAGLDAIHKLMRTGRTNGVKNILLRSLTLLIFCASVVAQEQDKPLVFRNVNVFDGSRLIRRTNVLVRDGLVSAIGRNFAIPQSAQVIDGQGKTLLPGLIDAHVHLGITQGDQFLREALNFGVTTELEMWGGDTSIRLKNTAAGRRDVADLRTAGTGVTVPKGHPTQMGGPPFPTLAPNDDVQAFVDARIAEGADYIKIIYEHSFPTLTKQQLQDVIAAVHRRNKLVVVHATRQRDARDAIAAGADGLAHIFADSPIEPDFAKFAAEKKIFVIPTLSVVEAITQNPEKPWWEESRLTQYMFPSTRTMLARKFPPGFTMNLKLEHAEAAVSALRRAGVVVLAGTDAPSPSLAHGVSLHRELELLVRSGLSPVEALASATSETARAFGLADRGRIAAGARADLVLVNGDPTVDIKATRDIAGVWKLGSRVSRYRVIDRMH